MDIKNILLHLLFIVFPLCSYAFNSKKNGKTFNAVFYNIHIVKQNHRNILNKFNIDIQPDTNFYSTVVENFKDDDERLNAHIMLPDTFVNEDFANFPITVLKKGNIWLLSEFGEKKFKFIEGNLKGFVRLKDKIWFYYLIDGEARIYSVNLSTNKKVEWHATIRNNEDYGHVYEDDMHGTNASLYAISDTLIALECNPDWPRSFTDIFVYSIFSKELKYCYGQIPKSMWNKYPELTKEAKKLEKMLVVEPMDSIENLFLNYPDKKIRLTDTRLMPRDYDNNGGGIEFLVSHKGTKVIYFVVEAVGDFMHGEGYIVNTDGTNNTKIFSDAFGKIRYWNRTNDNLYILENGNLSLVYGEKNKVMQLDTNVEWFEIEL